MKHSFLIVFLLFLSLLSCRSPKEVRERTEGKKEATADSVSVMERQSTKVVSVPASQVNMRLDLEAVRALPPGASYQAKDGNATATVTKHADNTIGITANCDSLNILVESLTREVYRLKAIETELKTHLNEQKTIEVNKLNGWQHFQIYGFRLMAAALIIYLLIKKFKSKIIQLWQRLN